MYFSRELFAQMAHKPLLHAGSQIAQGVRWNIKNTYHAKSRATPLGYVYGPLKRGMYRSRSVDIYENTLEWLHSTRPPIHHQTASLPRSQIISHTCNGRRLVTAGQSEVNMPSPRVRGFQFHKNSVAHRKSCDRTFNPPLYGWLQNPHPYTFVCGACDHPFEFFPYPMCHYHSRHALLNGAFSLVGIIFLLRAMGREIG
jgi:hypothetical protein